ncbi:hypothetical protein AGMMS49942_21930 [Spirochaetia bacterium]|nr:hypothetical protein AGMMS49942_21930 [Spirochaetia bacterium]
MEERIMGLSTFLSLFQENIKSNQKYCFVLGSGASQESGIKTGQDLMKIWIEELNSSKFEVVDISRWRKELKLDKDLDKLSYSELFTLRYYNNPKSGIQYLENMMEGANPEEGYYNLAELLAKTSNNIAITTNFDKLLENAFWDISEKNCKVIGEEGLIKYFSLPTHRPTILKVHGDLFLYPKNSLEDTNALKEDWKNALTAVFNEYIPIIIGYSGGDVGFMDFLKESKLDNGIYWFDLCDESKLKNDVRNIITQNNGRYIKIEGFSNVMIKIREKLELPDAEDLVQEHEKKRKNAFKGKKSDASNESVNDNLNNTQSNSDDIRTKNNAIVLNTWKSQEEFDLSKYEFVADYELPIELGLFDSQFPFVFSIKKGDGVYILTDNGRTLKELDKIFELKEPDVIKSLVAILKDCGVKKLGSEFCVELDAEGIINIPTSKELLYDDSKLNSHFITAKYNLLRCISFMDQIKLFYE